MWCCLDNIPKIFHKSLWNSTLIDSAARAECENSPSNDVNLIHSEALEEEREILLIKLIDLNWN